MTVRRWGAAAVAGLALTGMPAAWAQDEAEVDRMWQDAQSAFQQAQNTKSGWDQVREKLQAVLARDPKHFLANQQMAKSYELESNKGPAHEWWCKASDAKPEHITAAINAGMGFIRYKKHDQALPYLQRAQAALEKGTEGPLGSDDETRIALLVIPGAIVETLWLTGKKDEAVKVASAGIQKTPFYPSLTYYLGLRAEEEGDNRRARALYDRGLKQLDGDKDAQKKFGDSLGHANHAWGLEDRRNEAAERINLLTARDNYVEKQVAKYGEIKNGGATFFDPLTELTVDLPPAKLLKLKKDQRYPWVFWFERSHEVAAGSINTHVIDLVWHRDDLNSADIIVRCHAGPFSVEMNLQSGGKAKFVEPERLAEGLLEDATKAGFVEVKNKKEPKKGPFGKGYDGYHFSFEGREKLAVENHAQQVAQGQKPREEPAVWEVRYWVVKGKKYTFYIEVQSRMGVWKARQREIDILLKSIKFPA